MAGDLYVRISKEENAGGRFNNNENIDANSVASGNMQTPVTVGNRTVYMTSEGADYFRTTMENARERASDTGGRQPSASVNEDPGWFRRLFVGHSEQFKGNP